MSNPTELPQYDSASPRSGFLSFFRGNDYCAPPLCINEQINTEILADDNLALEEDRNLLSATGNWIKRNKTKIALGAACISVGITLAADPFEETKETVVDAAPWVASGFVASEALFVLGAGMMVGSVGDKIGNPLKLKGKLPDIAEKADKSKLFKAGFAINTTGALGDFFVLSGGVMKELPFHSWGVLSLTLLDVGVTVAVRKAILDTVRVNEYASVRD